MISGATSAGSLQRSSYIDPRLSRNILRLAREQQDEIDREQAGPAQPQPPQASSSSSLARIRHSKADMPEDDDDDDDNVPQRRTADDHEDDDDDDDFPEDAGEDEEVYEELEIDPSDTQLLARLGAAAADHDDEHDLGAGGARRGGSSLADMIMAKIEEADKISGGGKVTFKAGSLDEPETWTPHATLAATKIFVSNLKASQTQKFFDLVLLDKFRNEIRDEGKTSYQIYEALKKGLYKPAAFFKGLLFPLCESGTLTLKEAAIVASVLTKVSIPVLHSAAALLRLAEMEYTGPTSLLIRVLLDKKYALPYKVVDALVFHFLKFSQEGSGVEGDRSGVAGVGAGERRMPVLWHQSLLV
ncbi:unnamed protein product, partial [Tilletia controversa]